MLDRYWQSGTGLAVPFVELDRMRREMAQLLETISSGRALRSRAAGVFPPVNVTQDREHYFIRAEIPGVKSGDLEVTANRNTVAIAGKRALDRDDKVSYHRCERPEGSFHRSVTLPGEFEAGKIEARHRAGVLTITVPKAEETKPKQIAVKAS